jgi:hypothetical protein
MKRRWGFRPFEGESNPEPKRNWENRIAIRRDRDRCLREAAELAFQSVQRESPADDCVRGGRVIERWPIAPFAPRVSAGVRIPKFREPLSRLERIRPGFLRGRLAWGPECQVDWDHR